MYASVVSGYRVSGREETKGMGGKQKMYSMGGFPSVNRSSQEMKHMASKSLHIYPVRNWKRSETRP